MNYLGFYILAIPMLLILPIITLYRAIRDMNYLYNLKYDYRHFFKIVKEVNEHRLTQKKDKN